MRRSFSAVIQLILWDVQPFVGSVMLILSLIMHTQRVSRNTQLMLY
jgi:hypothetical protein